MTHPIHSAYLTTIHAIAQSLQADGLDYALSEDRMFAVGDNGFVEA